MAESSGGHLSRGSITAFDEILKQISYGYTFDRKGVNTDRLQTVTAIILPAKLTTEPKWNDNKINDVYDKSFCLNLTIFYAFTNIFVDEPNRNDQ